MDGFVTGRARHVPPRVRTWSLMSGPESGHERSDRSRTRDDPIDGGVHGGVDGRAHQQPRTRSWASS